MNLTRIQTKQTVKTNKCCSKLSWVASFLMTEFIRLGKDLKFFDSFIVIVLKCFVGISPKSIKIFWILSEDPVCQNCSQSLDNFQIRRLSMLICHHILEICQKNVDVLAHTWYGALSFGSFPRQNGETMSRQMFLGRGVNLLFLMILYFYILLVLSYFTNTQTISSTPEFYGFEGIISA